MKKFLLAFSLLFSSLSFSAEEIDYDRLSESLGHLIVRNLVNPDFDFNLDKLVQGIQDERAGKPSPLSEEEYEEMICAIQETLFIQAADKNLSEANNFLQHNLEKTGIKEIDSKLQYEIAEQGKGDLEISCESVPLIHYKGTLLDGTVFANSYEYGEPITLPLSQTIPGFSKGLIGMKEGEKRVLYVHPEFAYGTSGHLPPNSLLIFEIEVVKADTQQDFASTASINESDANVSMNADRALIDYK